MAFNPVERINGLVWGDALSRYGLGGRILGGAIRYLYAVVRDLVSGQLTLRAMSLVYTTLLSVVPLLAFSFSVLKGFGIHKRLEAQMYLILEPLGDKGAEITDNVMRLVNNVNGGVLGGISLAFFIYTAISMVQKVEESFNYVWYVSKSRSFARRFTEYAFVLLIGPVVIVIALGSLTALQNDRIVQWLLSNELVGPLFVASGKLTPYLLVAAVFTFLYHFVPNTRVKLSSALVGGLAGGFMWASIGLIFTTFIVTAARTQAVYASFAIAIVTLMWLYANWMVLLIGAQLAFYFQNPEYLRLGRREPHLSNSMRERLALNIMYLVGQAFRDPESTIDLRQLSNRLEIPSLTIAPVMQALEDGGLLTSNEDEQLLPGCETARIRLEEIVGIVRSRGDTGSHAPPRWAAVIDGIGAELDRAVGERIGDRSLADLLDEAPST